MVDGPINMIHDPKMLWDFERDEPVAGYDRSLLFVACMIVVVLSFLCCGCIHPSEPCPPDDGNEPVEPIEPTPDPIGNEKEIGSPNVSMTVGLPPQLWELVAEHLKKNAVTIERPVKIERDGLTLDAPAGLKASFDVKSEQADVTFSQPYPTVAKWKFWSKLHGMTLKPDGSGVASTGTGDWKFRWLEDGANKTSIPAPPPPEPADVQAKPIVLAWGAPRCSACLKAKRELKSDDFEVRWDEGERPKWATNSSPFFWWHTSEADPRGKPTSDTKQHVGWGGLNDFLSRWKNSRKSPKPAAGVGYRRHTNVVWGIEPANRSRYIQHLLTDGIHCGKFTRQQLERLNDQELLNLHADDHEGCVQWSELK